MDFSAIAGKAIEFVVPFLCTKAGKKVASDISEAVNNEIELFWEWIKPLFIVEEKDKKLIEKLEKEPENKTTQGGFIYELSQKLENNEIAVQQIENWFNKIQEKQSNSSVNINQTHFGTGDNVGGDKIIYTK